MSGDVRVNLALRLVDKGRSQGVALKCLGGIGCWLHIAGEGERALPFKRDYHDVDLVVPRKQRRAVSRLLTDAGLRPAESFNAVQGETRLMFFDEQTSSQVDVFLGLFSMCHEVVLGDDAFRPPEHPSLDLVELVLTKLQVVECNPKDLNDVAGLLAFREIGLGPGSLNAGRFADRLGGDWGLWRTVTQNLDQLADHAQAIPAHGPVIIGRVEELRAAAESSPKSIRWRARARVGDRVVWYETPEEPETESLRVR